jgi:hypothetical protein
MIRWKDQRTRTNHPRKKVDGYLNKGLQNTKGLWSFLGTVCYSLSLHCLKFSPYVFFFLSLIPDCFSFYSSTWLISIMC